MSDEMSKDERHAIIWKSPTNYRFPWQVDEVSGQTFCNESRDAFATWREAMEYATGGPLS